MSGRAARTADFLPEGAARIVWAHYKAALGGIYEILPGFAAACRAIVAASLMDRAPDAEITAEFAKASETLA